jgi:hypothetical protein
MTITNAGNPSRLEEPPTPRLAGLCGPRRDPDPIQDPSHQLGARASADMGLGDPLCLRPERLRRARSSLACVINVTYLARKRVEYRRGRTTDQTRERPMDNAPKSSRDHLIKTTNEGKIELTEKELSRVAGGKKHDGTGGGTVAAGWDLVANKVHS